MSSAPSVFWNATGVGYPFGRTLHSWIEEQADRTPESLAVLAEGERLTYAELEARANRLAHRLRRLGVGPGVRVGICAERSPGLVVGLLAILKAGGAYVPLDPGYPRDRLAFLVADSAVPVLLVQGEVLERLPESEALRVDLGADLSAGPSAESADRPVPLAGPGDLAYVIYTSGSTGRPKGAMNEHRAICNRLLWMQRAYGLEAGERVLQKTPFSFDVSVWELFWPLMRGAALVLARPGGHQDAEYLAGLIVRERVTTLHFVPPMLRAFLEQPPERGRFADCAATLRRVLCSGEALPSDLPGRFFARLPGVELHNLYGPTEAAVDVTAWACDPLAAVVQVPIGRPVDNTRIHLLDSNLREVAVGEPGELYIGGIQVGRGYWNRPGLTAERFVPDPFVPPPSAEGEAATWWEPGGRLYRTGDLARYLPDGAIEYLGRTDFQVKVRGHRIELGEIEAVLDEHPGVAGSVVAASPGPGGDLRLVAYLRPSPKGAAGVRRWLRLEREERLAGQRFHELPDGTVVAHRGRGETDFLWREIFERRGYLQHGIVLRDGDRVFDVGANVGLFSLFAAREAAVRLHAFEPIPPLAETLAVNAALHGLDLRLHACALGDREGSAELTFYPHATLISGRFADLAEEREVVRSFLSSGGDESGGGGLLEHEIEELLAERLESERHLCPLRTLSGVIAEEGIERIDLLKVDVEKSELEVLAGLRNEDWPKIRQVVVEVHDREGRLDEVLGLLRRQGFEVAVEQDRELAGACLYNLYARRPSEENDEGGERAATVAREAAERGWTRPAQLVAEVRERLRERLPEPMIPAAFVLLEELPLNPNGKVDRAALPPPESVRAEGERGLRPLRTPTEEGLAAIWCEVLGVDAVGGGDRFLDLGGHSLLATQVLARVRERLGAELSLRDTFDHPVLADLAACIDSTLAGERSREAAQHPLVPVPRTGDLPLSFAQERVWFLQQLDPDIRSYQFQARLRLRGALDPEALRRSLAEVVRRHEIFRTTFPQVGDQPVQRFHSPQEAPLVVLPWVDLSGLPSEEREAEAERVLVQESRRLFDLGRLPLVRWTLVRLAPRDHVWLHVEHHLVHDGWSFNRLLAELAALYGADLRGEPSPLAEAVLQFADWAVWQRAWMEGEEAAAQLAFWRRTLAGRPGVLELPLDHPRPKRQSFRGAVLRRELPHPLCIALREASRRRGVSLYMLMQAGFAALLARLSGQEQVNVGSAVANRRLREAEGLIGMIVDNVVLANDLAGDPTVGQLVERVRRVCLEAGANQEIPFDHVVEALQPERDLAYNPLFQASFSFHDSPLGDLDFPGLEAELEEGLSNGSAKFDLNVIGIPRERPRRKGEEGGGITLLWEYATALFEPATMERAVTAFYRLLAGFAGDPEVHVSELPLLGAEEVRQLEVWSGSQSPALELEPAARAHELFERRADNAPGSLALAEGGRSLTYGELEAAANRLAWRLIGLGVGPEGRIGVFLERSLELPMALLAVLKAGAAYLPLDPSHPAERLAFLLADAKVAILLTSEALAGKLPSGSARVVRVDDPELRHESALRPEVPGFASSLAYVIYTSGSTGRPKGTELTHGGLRNLVAWHQRDYFLTPADRTTLVASPAFDASVWEVWPTLAEGASLHVPPEDVRASPPRLLAWLASERITVCFLPTPLAEACLDLEPGTTFADLSLRALLTGGDRLHRVRGRLPFRLFNHYGPTEGTVVATVGEVAAGVGGEDPPSIGGPILGARAHVLDHAFGRVPQGVVGELFVGGTGLARGYLDRPELTAERFLPDPFAEGERLYRTGDLVRWRNGKLDFVGRTDHQVKIRGFRIELGEIEGALLAHPEVRGAAVLVRDEGGLARLAAYAVPREGTPAGADLGSRLREHLQARLPEVMVPSALVLLPSLPLSPNGKVDLAALPAPEPLRPRAAGRQSPRTPTEELLAGLWSDLLGVAAVGRDDSFFELGGHSLLASRLVSRVQAALGAEVPLRAVFEEPTLAALAAQVDRVREGAGGGAGLIGPPLVALPPERRSGPLAASFSQQRLWFLDRLEPGSVTYNLARAYILQGDLDAGALSGALESVVGRHEALRTVFVEQSGELRQLVREAGLLAVPFVDLSAHPAPHEEMLGLAEEEARRPFHLARGPLFRATLLRLGEREHGLLLGMHHIVSDGWSLSILVRELGAFYRHRSRSPLPAEPLPDLPVQYADFAAWQREALSGAALEERLAWWKSRLAGAPPVVDLPLDRPRPGEQSYRGRRTALALGAEPTAQLESFCRRLGVTPFMALLAGFATLLARYGGQSEIVVGTPIANRARPELENLIGFFANTLALRVDLGGSPSAAELARRVRELALGAFARQDLPFERLVDELRPERSLSHSPVFQVLLALQNLPEAKLDLPGVDSQVLEIDKGKSPYDLSLFFFPGKDGLLAQLTYAQDLFDQGTAERLLRHLRSLLAAFARTPEQRIAELPILDEDEREEILARGRPEPTAIPGLLVQQQIEAQAARRPEAVAIAGEGGSLTYGALNAEANRLAHHLRRQGVGPEVRVAVCLQRSPRMVVALLAVLKAGGAYVPLDPGYPAERLTWVLDDSGAQVLLTDGALLERLPRFDGEAFLLDEVDLTVESDDDPVVLADPENLAYVLYTSGSTGRPQGVAVRHRGVMNFLASMAERPGLAERDLLLAVTTIAFDIAVLELFLPLTRGARIELVDRDTASDGFRLKERLVAAGATVMQATPATWRLLLEAGWSGSPDLKILCGGEALPPDLAGELRARTGELWNVYGPTETTVWSTVHRVSKEELARSIPLGEGIANTGVYLLECFEAGLEPVPLGAPGELYLGGEGLARGYLSNPGKTAERFVPSPFSAEGGARLYRTGDRVRRRPVDGALEFLGRIDQQVKVRGYRIEIGEIEVALGARPEVRESAVVARELAPGSQGLVAYLVLDAASGDAVLAAVRAALAKSLPEYMQPERFVLLPSLPKTPNGKLDRKALPAPQLLQSRAASPQRPCTANEELLAGLWSELLGVAEVGRDDSFFELGGQSLLASRLMSRVHAALGVEIPVRALFEQPTLAGLAAWVERAREGGAGGASPADPPLVALPPERRSGPLAASFSQQRLWFLDRLEPGSVTYNLARAFILGGDLDTVALARALATVVRRHEILRTVLFEQAGDLWQRVQEARLFSVPLVDLSTDPSPHEELRRLMNEEARRPFDLARGPLFRATLLRLGEREHALLLGMHHIVSDGWSLSVLVRELGIFYRSQVGEAPASGALPDLPVQYADFAAWQRQALSGAALEERLAWWKRRLEDAPPVVDLPLDRPRPSVQSYEGRRTALALDAETTARLEAACRRLGVTPFMILLAGFATLLTRYGEQSEVVVGTPIANRGRPELEDLIGLFANTLALRVDLGGDPSAAEVAGRVRELALGAFARQDLPFERLVDELRPERSLSHSPVFQVLLALQNLPDSQLDLPGIDSRALELAVSKSPYDLSLFFFPQEDGLLAQLTYAQDLFDEGTAERLLRHLRNLLAGFVRTPERKVAELPLLDADERGEILARGRPEPTALSSLLVQQQVEAQAARRPDLLAIVGEGEALTYGGLNAEANRLAHHLQRQGVGPEVRVAVCLRRSPRMVAVLLAVLKAGGAYVPLDPGYPAERLAWVLEDSRARVLVTDGALLERLPRFEGEALLLDEVDLTGESEDDPVFIADPENLAYVLYTSGSTGRPQGVAVRQRGVTNFLASMAERPGFAKRDVLLAVTTIAFDISVLELFLPLTRGARIELVGRDTASDGRRLKEKLIASGATAMQATPATWRLLLEAGWEGRPGLKVLCGGEALPPDLAGELLARTGELWNLYGPTETTVWSTVHPVSLDDVARAIPLGEGIANTGVYLLDRFETGLEPVPLGAPGELYLGGEGLARGYLNNPGKTAERFVPNPFSVDWGVRLYRTGDRVRRRAADGALEYLGRIDQQVKVRGYRIEIGEIEAALGARPEVRESAVAARELAPGSQGLVAYLVLDATAGEDSVEAVRAALAKTLPEYMQPQRFVTLPSLPKTPNGKVDRKALPAPEGSTRNDYIAPRSPLEAEVARVWCDVLGVDRVGIEDRFWDLGGHSLLATRVFARLAASFGVELPLQALFRAPTLGGFSAAVGEAVLATISDDEIAASLRKGA